jgi:hypothetical protein
MLLRLSRLCPELEKLGTFVPAITGLTGDNHALLDRSPHGLDGRLRRPAVARVKGKLKKTEGPRSYGPRLSKP